MDNSHKEHDPIDVCRALAKSLQDRIEAYKAGLADLRQRELKKAEDAGTCPTCSQVDLPGYCDCAVGFQLVKAEGKQVRTGASVVKTMCKGCSETHLPGKHTKGRWKKNEMCADRPSHKIVKGETMIAKDKETKGNDSGDQGARMQDRGLATPNAIPNAKQVTPKKHAEGGNGAKAKANSPFGKADVPMAKPPSGGTGLAPKAPAMSKPTMAKAFGIPGRPAPGSAKAAVADASHAATAPAAAAPAAVSKPHSEFADFMPAGKFTPAGAGIPGAKPTLPGVKPKTAAAIPGKTPTTGAAPFKAPPTAVRPAAAPAGAPVGAKPAAPVAKPPAFGKSEDFGNCALCGKREHNSNC